MGGTSLSAVRLAAEVNGVLAGRLTTAALLGAQPLAAVIAATRAAPPRPAVRQPVRAALRPACAGQRAMLAGEDVNGGAAARLLFSAELRGSLDERRLVGALAALTRRHESLRSYFVRDGAGLKVRVLPDWTPRLLHQEIPGATASVDGIHAALAAASGRLLRPFERPPVLFIVTRMSRSRWVLSLLVHHAISDGWSIGLLLRELADAYQGRMPAELAGSPDLIRAAEVSPATRRALTRRAAQLQGVPPPVPLPSDLIRPPRPDGRAVRWAFALSPAARQACAGLARRCGITRNAVLLGAWALVISHRTGVTDLVVSVPSASRSDGALRDVVGLAAKLLPVRCRICPGDTVRAYLVRVGAELRAALDAMHVPLDWLADCNGAAGMTGQNPFARFGFAAHDELIPATLKRGDLDITIHEGHCGGTTFDAILYVQRWEQPSRLALDYATCALGPHEVAALAAELDYLLTSFGKQPDQACATIPAVTAAQRRRLDRWGNGGPVRASGGLWQLINAVCAQTPHAVAVRDSAAGHDLTYWQLRLAAEHQSAALAVTGVRAGDHVLVVTERSACEIVAVLATLRLGAAYIGLAPGTPPTVTAQILAAARPRALVCDQPRRHEALTANSPPVVCAADPWRLAASPAAPPPAAAPDPSRIAYIAFTSGSTGTPKGVRITHRGVIRLARDPQFLIPGATSRFLRLAPLAFDASTLEIFAPLLTGGTIDIYPAAHPDPAELAAFLAQRHITGLWLTAGLFQIIAACHPEAFRPARQLLTGGDIAPAAEVRQVLHYCPGLRITNGYGPTENTTFTTVHHLDSPAAVEDPVPIGRPIPGTRVAILNETGQPVPAGAIGELCAFGPGLATGYLDAPEETSRAFPRSGSGERYYRTGDLARWDGTGRLQFIGRRDQQVKIRGFRVESAAVARLLRQHPRVRDAIITTTHDQADRHLVAAIIADPDPELLPQLHALASQQLPAPSVPTRWTIITTPPTTTNGKIDLARLAQIATPIPTSPPETRP